MNKEDILLRRLGETDFVTQFFRGEGIGTMIINMIIASYKADNKAGCRFITVDAYADALDFYYKQGFKPLSKEDEDSPTRLLYFDLENIK